jgi:hypothetical protein
MRTRLDDVGNLLADFGLTISPEDPLISFVLQTVEEQVKNATNQEEVPEGLHHAVVEMAAGKFMALKKGSGQLDGFDIDLDAAVKQIQEGDTNTVFAIGEGCLTPEARLDALISLLLTDRSDQFARYRRLRW